MIEKDQPYDMWNYWRDKYGILEALKSYYPTMLESSGELQHAVILVENGKRLINSIMEEKKDD